MNPRSENDQYDLHKMLVKPLYFGLFTNIIVPMALLMVCFYLNNNYFMGNRVGNNANILFYILGAVSVAQAGGSLWWRSKLLSLPMIKHEETFEHDLTSELHRRLRPVFVVIAGISVYGYVYFFLTGRFNESVFMVFFSFIVFQVVRPRLGSLRKLIARQKEHAKKGHFLSD